MNSACCSGVSKRVVSKRVVLADVPPERKPERGHVRQNHPFGNRPFISQWKVLGVDKRVVSKRVVSADVPPERKKERGYVRQNHPFTKPPFYLPVSCDGSYPELCLQSAYVRNGRIWEFRRGPVLHPNDVQCTMSAFPYNFLWHPFREKILRRAGIAAITFSKPTIGERTILGVSGVRRAVISQNRWNGVPGSLPCFLPAPCDMNAILKPITITMWGARRVLKQLLRRVVGGARDIYGCNLTWWAQNRQKSFKMPSFIV